MVLLHVFQMLCPGCVGHAVLQAERVLASDEATYMNDAELNLDGGILAGLVGAPVLPRP